MSSLIPPSPFDVEAARRHLASARGPVFWRSLEELADNDGFLRWLHQEQPQLAQALSVDRRGFLQFMAASLALAGLSACGHPPQDQIVPYVHAPEGQIDGLPRFFATTLLRDEYAQGVLVENRMGRPTKVEGNPQHPASLGATDIFAQAAVLQLWDPERSQTVMNRGVTSSWDAFAAAAAQATERHLRDGGKRMRILTGAMTSPTLSAQLGAMLERFPGATWHVHQTLGNANARAGARLALGVPLATRLRLDRAKTILSLDADFLNDPTAGVRYARDYAATRTPEGNPGTPSRLYVVESTPSVTGGMADHRLALETDRLERFVGLLARGLGIDIEVPDEADAQQVRWLSALLADLKSNRGASLIVVGASQAPWVHGLGHLLNAALGNIGTTIEYTDPVERNVEQAASVADLVAAMRAGQVDTLWILDGNPAYDAPAHLRFADVLTQVPHVIHLGLYRNETGMLAEWHLPTAHQLECWSDARAYDGTASIGQPLIAPLYDGRSPAQVLAMVLGQNLQGRALVRQQWQQQLPDETAFNAALQQGVIPNTALPPRTASVSATFLAQVKLGPTAGTALELLFRADPTIGDGAWSNNGWLQELPKPLTQLTWDNAALVSPALAAQHQLRNGDVIELRLGQQMLAAPVWIMPGQAARSVTLHLGYGRRQAGRVGDGRGVDAYQLRSQSNPWGESGLQIRATGTRYELASTQHHFNLEGRDLLRVGTWAQLRTDPHFATAADPYRGKPPSLYADRPPGEYAWGMSIDLNACIGCKACTIACQSENNIPVVGKEEVQRGREMHWIRVDRYYEGDAANPRAYSQPVPCMMCEHAPCEVVCPVEATVHDDEGLNVQVYNRCVGTRFCSNNCPYKVRRFNFLQYADNSTESLKAQRNPEVTVRRRGVMEKCTYCTQRIQSAHIEADKQDRRIRDGEILTACQAVCPTQAIRFGDIADATSAVAQAKASARNYVMLGELNTRPRTSYLARLRNPNPLLGEDPP
ncbi:MAG TPA: TAT-variant-translocated molybdopterin oxidoreductase [Steroidobacteraceae bacterium]|jgi:molybdopterin-containing oxidoreductase family iron-sulfur binding subunit|nr:TAT-variant-translocated molybdopterin oxidoreductase [Steroidobacteraceae bacterium]